MSQTENHILEPGFFKLDGGAMFGIIPKPLWNKVAPSDEQNRIDLALRLWLMQIDNRVIVVDTGIGDYHGEKFDQRFAVRNCESPLKSVLAPLGLSPTDVTDLIISHLHFDHVGGIGVLENGKMIPAFPNATLHLHKQHYDYALNPTERDSGSFHVEDFKPVVEYYQVKNQLHWLEGEKGVILDLGADSIRFICSMGHTPHLMHPYNSKYIYMADLIPTSNHIHIPWVMGYDISPGVTTADKRKFLDFISLNDLTMIFEHDPKFWGGKIVRDDKNQFKTGELFERKNAHSYRV